MCEERGSFCPQCGEPLADLSTPAPEDPYPGQILAGQFEIGERVGAGGMGAVYRATQLSLGKAVAVKILHRRMLGDPTLEKRFRREAQAASRLAHPNTIQVLDYGKAEDGALFIVMEFVEGRDLGRIIREDFPLAWPRVCDLLAQVCAALDEAHSAGIVHRDLKPENIVVTRRRRGEELSKVLDFGIAKVRDRGGDDEAPLTQAGTVCGTPEYMAPEQARGVEAGPGADLYSLGVILYQLLCGELPFQAANTLGIVTKHISEPVTPPSQRCPGRPLPQQLESICLRLLEKDPADRPPSAAAVRGLLLGAGAELGGAPLPSSALLSVSALSRVGLASPSPESPDPPAPRPMADDDRAPTQEVSAHEPLDVAAALKWPVSLHDVTRPVRALDPAPEGAVDDGEPAPADTDDATQDAARVRRGLPTVLLVGLALFLGGLAVGGGVWWWHLGGGVGTVLGADTGPRVTDARVSAAAPADLAPAPAVRPDVGLAVAPPAAPADTGPTVKAPAPRRPPGRQRVVPEAAPGAEQFANGRQLFLAGRTRSAILAYRKALREGYSSPLVHFELGRCYLRVGDRAQARRYYERYLRVGRDPKKRRTAAAILSSIQ